MTPRILRVGACVALAILLSACAVTVPQSAPSSLPVPSPTVDLLFAVQCQDISRAHTAFVKEFASSITTIEATHPGTSTRDIITEHEIKTVQATAEELRKATANRADQPSKSLAVAVAEFNYALSMLNLENTIGDGKWKNDTLAKVKIAAVNLAQVYAGFAATCPQL